MEEEYININDKLDVKIIFDVDDEEEMTVELVGAESTKEGEVSINSPLGKAIYGKK